MRRTSDDNAQSIGYNAPVHGVSHSDIVSSGGTLLRKFGRRDVLKSSVAFTATLGLHTVNTFANPAGTVDRLRMAVLGTGGRGRQLIGQIVPVNQAQIVALCDPDQARLEQGVAHYQEKCNEYKTKIDKVDLYNDYRRVLEREDIDAVVIAAPNHWHALMTIHACQHGKHVFVEKPVCHTVWEGRKMVEAAEHYKRIVVSGFQNRSDTGIQQAMALIHSGELGAIKKVRGLCYRNRNSIGKRSKPTRIPKSLNYDLWLGPAEEQTLLRNRLHYDWHWDFNTGNGDMGNQGPHELDLIRWALGDPGHAQSVMSFGGRFGWNDAGNTPNMQFALFDFGNQIPVIFEVRNLHQKGKNLKHVGRYSPGPSVGIIVTCEKGEYRGGRGGGAIFDQDGNEVQKFAGEESPHMPNFVHAVLAGDATLLPDTLENSFYSSCMSHLANISVRVGTETDKTNLASLLASNSDANEVFERFSEQLDLWKINTAETPWSIGPELTFDSGKEQFVEGENLAAANKLLRRNDRANYQVPDKV